MQRAKLILEIREIYALGNAVGNPDLKARALKRARELGDQDYRKNEQPVEFKVYGELEVAWLAGFLLAEALDTCSGSRVMH